jgi:hypothetical protein
VSYDGGIGLLNFIVWITNPAFQKAFGRSKQRVRRRKRRCCECCLPVLALAHANEDIEVVLDVDAEEIEDEFPDFGDDLVSSVSHTQLGVRSGSVTPKYRPPAIRQHHYHQSHAFERIDGGVGNRRPGHRSNASNSSSGVGKGGRGSINGSRAKIGADIPMDLSSSFGGASSATTPDSSSIPRGHLIGGTTPGSATPIGNSGSLIGGGSGSHIVRNDSISHGPNIVIASGWAQPQPAGYMVVHPQALLSPTHAPPSITTSSSNVTTTSTDTASSSGSGASLTSPSNTTNNNGGRTL